jgi:ribosome-associated toxin RatA of RatAB toxin-antitoxin module
MASIHRSALLPFSNQQLYALVNDVEAYPEFMDGCVGAEVISVSAQSMEARLDLARGGISQSFTTLNQLTPYESVRLSLKDGPFEYFDGIWRFQALAAQACKVSLDLEFVVRGGLLSAAAAGLLDRVTGNLVDAVVRRAGEVYG